MDGLLKRGTILLSESGNKYIVKKMLGAGGQGEVYEVENNGEHFALKWYYKHTATNSQKEIIENLISKGSPDGSFLWPEDLVLRRSGEPFGYVMPLRPKNYKSIVDLMKCKIDPSFYVLCKTAFNLTKCYQKLHSMGYSYRDISFGNLFFDPQMGNVLICDNDNVSINGRNDSSVYGTPRFMAPEIVLGQATPSRNTDLFSLAVLLFYIFMMNHPLEGKMEADIKCMDIHAMNKLYGTNPIFIFDPNDKRNRPVPGYHDNALIYWSLYPARLKDLFTKAFTVGISSPSRRITENKWLDAFTDIISSIVICPSCGAEVFYDENIDKLGISHSCWSCHENIIIPPQLNIGNRHILLTPATKIYSHYVYGNYDMDTIIGSVVRNPQNPNLWGVRNEDNTSWLYEKTNGMQLPVNIGKSAAIATGAKIYFGATVGEFK